VSFRAFVLFPLRAEAYTSCPVLCQLLPLYPYPSEPSSLHQSFRRDLCAGRFPCADPRLVRPTSAKQSRGDGSHLYGRRGGRRGREGWVDGAGRRDEQDVHQVRDGSSASPLFSSIPLESRGARLMMSLAVCYSDAKAQEPSPSSHASTSARDVV
jgi:hypothetical protein